MNRRNTILSLIAAGLGFNPLSGSAQSSAWPNKPVRLIVPYAPGGAADVLARTISPKLSEMWGQQVVVDNKPGGNTIIGAVETKRAVPDGYTLFQPIASTLTFNPFVYSKLPYQPATDFTPIAMLAEVALLVLASNNSGLKTLQDMIVQAKLKPDTLTIGTGAGVQIQTEQWMRDWGIKLRSITYKNGADISRAVVAGEVDLAIDAVANNQAYIQANRVQGLAVNVPNRMRGIPSVPTLDELKVGHTAPAIWHGWMAPTGLPLEISTKIARDLKAVMELPDVKERMAGLGYVTNWMPTEQFAAKIQSESRVISRLVKELDIKLD